MFKKLLGFFIKSKCTNITVDTNTVLVASVKIGNMPAEAAATYLEGTRKMLQTVLPDTKIVVLASKDGEPAVEFSTIKRIDGGETND